LVGTTRFELATSRTPLGAIIILAQEGDSIGVGVTSVIPQICEYCPSWDITEDISVNILIRHDWRIY